MRVPTLRQVEDDLARINAMVPKLTTAAKWAWPMAFSRVRHGEAGRAGGVARPVEAAVATEGAPEWVVRGEVGRAGILVERAVLLLIEAAACLARAHAAADASPAPPPDPGGRPLVNKAELARARSAQAKRNAALPRGVGHGER